MAEITVKHLGLEISIEGKFRHVSEQDLYTSTQRFELTAAYFARPSSCRYRMLPALPVDSGVRRF